jgi:2-polyprenyl-3-methyl-5-hydroxy-6-metoxy-1,4-benzoquinol methylase
MQNDNDIPSQKPLPSDEEAGAFWSDCIYAASEKSVLIPEIFREVYGDLAPERLVCPFSFVTNMDLQYCAETLGPQSSMNLLDLACGGGGPGLWIARETGANLVGVDYSKKALEQAACRAAKFGIAQRVRYCCASIKATGLEPGTFDAVVSIDALWMATDKAAVFREVKRLMRPQRWLIFTTWEAKSSATEDFAGTDEYRSMLRDAGFKIERYEETARWEELQREVYRRWLSNQYSLAKELGVGVAGMLINEAIWLTTKLGEGTDRLSHSRRILVACRSASQ